MRRHRGELRNWGGPVPIPSSYAEPLRSRSSFWGEGTRDFTCRSLLDHALFSQVTPPITSYAEVREWCGRGSQPRCCDSLHLLPLPPAVDHTETLWVGRDRPSFSFLRQPVLFIQRHQATQTLHCSNICKWRKGNSKRERTVRHTPTHSPLSWCFRWHQVPCVPADSVSMLTNLLIVWVSSQTLQDANMRVGDLSLSYVRFWDPMYCSSPGSSVHGILQARTLEWVAMPSSGGSSHPRLSQTHGLRERIYGCRREGELGSLGWTCTHCCILNG